MTANTALDITRMRSSAADAVSLLRTLANEDRLMLLCKLSVEELCVSELEERLGIRQPSLSQQLGVLRREGMVATRREGKNIFYRIADPRALAVLQALYNLYCPE
jgi:DNA-binding transcriptional ArsR family regulator